MPTPWQSRNITAPWSLRLLIGRLKLVVIQHRMVLLPSTHSPRRESFIRPSGRPKFSTQKVGARRMNCGNYLQLWLRMWRDPSVFRNSHICWWHVTRIIFTSVSIWGSYPIRFLPIAEIGSWVVTPVSCFLHVLFVKNLSSRWNMVKPTNSPWPMFLVTRPGPVIVHIFFIEIC